MKIYITSEHGPDYMPTRQTMYAAAFDIRTPRDIFLPPGTETVVDTGLVFDGLSYSGKRKNNLMYKLLPRSSAGIGHNLRLKNTVGLIDQDYAGPSDKLLVCLQRPRLCDEQVAQFDSMEQAYEEAPDLIQKVSESYFSKLGYSEYIGPDGSVYIFKQAESDGNHLLYKAGERFCQIVIEEHATNSVVLEFCEKSRRRESRGGVGSTGNS